MGHAKGKNMAWPFEDRSHLTEIFIVCWITRLVQSAFETEPVPLKAGIY